MNGKGLKPAWADQELRFDPYQFPQAGSYVADGAHADVTFTINETGAVIRQVISTGGVPMAISLPASAFRGVTARAVEEDNGRTTVTLELMHDNPNLSVPLLVAHDLSNVATDWRAWAQTFNLPMMLVEEDGVARPLYESAGPAAAKEEPTPRQVEESKMRAPRFRARCKLHSLGMRLVIDGKEIIAKN